MAFLLLNSGIQIRREKLAGLLWPDSEESNARTYLRQILWRLRKLIGEEHIRADKICVGFNSNSDYDLDVDTLINCAKDGNADELVAAVCVYLGDLLPGFYENWVLREREQLQHIYAERMGKLLDKLAIENRFEDILVWGERWITFGQSPEPAYRALMAAHTHLGDMAAMASTYQRCADALRDDLGVDPSPKTNRLYEQLSNGEMPSSIPTKTGLAASLFSDASLTKSSPAFLDADRPEIEPPLFVARQGALDYLNEVLATMLIGVGQIIFIAGDAGQGKTALVNEFVRRTTETHPDLLAVRGNCRAYSGVGDAHLPFRDVIRMLAGDVETDWTSGNLSHQQANKLWNLAPLTTEVILREAPGLVNTFVLGKVLQRASVGNIAGTDKEFSSNIFGQYTQVLQTLSQSHPLLIVLEDLHWADQASTGLLFHLGQQIQSSQIMILGTYRPVEIFHNPDNQRHPLGKVVNEFKRLYGGIVFDLNQFSQSENRNFLDALLDHEPNKLSESFRQAFFRQTAGNPLFTVELIQALKARGDLEQDLCGDWVAGHSLNWETLPPRVEGVIAERTQRLNNDQYEVMQSASVVGNEFSTQVIAEILDIDEWELHKQLSQELTRRHRLFRSLGEMQVGEKYISNFQFVHDLFRDFLYNELTTGERRLLHGKIASVLESYYENQLEEMAPQLAHHYDQAGNPTKAIDYLIVAGERSFTLSAFDDAQLAFERALELLPGENAAEQIVLQNRLGELLNKTGDLSEAAEILKEALNSARKLGDTDAQANVLYQLGINATNQGKWDTALEYLDQALLLARAGDIKGTLAKVLFGLGNAQFRTGKGEESRRNALETLEIAKEIGDQATLMNVFIGLGTLEEVYFKNLDAAKGWYEQCLALARKMGNLDRQGAALGNLGSVALDQQDWPTAISYCQEALSLFRIISHQMGIALVANELAISYLQAGGLEKVRPLILEGIQAARRTGSEVWLGAAAIAIAHQMVVAGDYQKCLQIVGLIFHHPAASYDIKTNQLLMSKLRVVLSEDEIQAGMGLGKELELDTVIDEYIADEGGI